MAHIQPDTTLPKPAKVKTYIALVTQTGTSNPTAIVLVNTLGETVTWTRTGVGSYNAGVPSALFDITKTVVGINIQYVNVETAIRRDGDIAIGVYTNFSGAPVDAQLNNTAIEIRIYP